MEDKIMPRAGKRVLIILPSIILPFLAINSQSVIGLSKKSVQLIQPWFFCSGRGYESSHQGTLCSSGLVASSTTAEPSKLVD